MGTKNFDDFVSESPRSGNEYRNRLPPVLEHFGYSSGANRRFPLIHDFRLVRLKMSIRPVSIFFTITLLLAFAAACGEDGGLAEGDFSNVDKETVEKISAISGIDDAAIKQIQGYSASTEDITLKKGVLVMRAESDGGFFAVKIVQDTGNEVMFNETVKYSGTYAIRIDDFENPIGPHLAPGPAKLEIIASKDWTISYSQEDLKIGRSSTFDISGTLDHVVPAIEFKPGNYTITASNDVEIGHFSVKLLNRDGNGHQLLVNQSHPQNDQFDFEINEADGIVNPAGLWTLIISSTGNWDVKIE